MAVPSGGPPVGAGHSRWSCGCYDPQRKASRSEGLSSPPSPEAGAPARRLRPPPASAWETEQLRSCCAQEKRRCAQRLEEGNPGKKRQPPLRSPAGFKRGSSCRPGTFIQREETQKGVEVSGNSSSAPKRRGRWRNRRRRRRDAGQLPGWKLLGASSAFG